MTPPLPSTPASTGGDDAIEDPFEDLRWVVGLVEDWLLHASDETLDELAEYVYGPAHPDHDRLRWIIELLGEAGARLRPTAQPAAAQPAVLGAAGRQGRPR
jgi:hypothetical protein